ncbi:MAG TPA: HEPN domain-containing protein [Ardenticatenaceae bacterium]|nr:HEPN domain-containing protein [Ardenticatenaceae bacterium]
MSDASDPLTWVARAEEDYMLAGIALRQTPPLVYGGTFHAQQCAEKYLKALLTASGHPFPRTHDLAALCDLCARAGITVPVTDEALQRLTAFAVQVRYPGNDPTVDEAQEALQIAQDVREFARTQLGLRL